jgi:hypothetical protein
MHLPSSTLKVVPYALPVRGDSDLSMLLLCVFLLANYLLAERRLRPWSAGLMVGMTAFFFPPINLFLSLQFKYFALMSLPLLACLLGIARELAPQMDRRQR